MTDLTFYTHPMSRGRIIRWMLEEVGQSYDTEILDFATSMKAPAYLSVNPMGKVPAIKHGETVITECAAICAYLADAFPQAGLAPPTSDRGAYYRWLFFTAGPLEQAVIMKAMGWQTPEARRAVVGSGSLEEVLDAIESRLDGRDHVAGDRFTAADLYLSSHLGWGMGFGTVEKRPTFERYVALHASRPAALRANEIDDALIAAQQQPEPVG